MSVTWNDYVRLAMLNPPLLVYKLLLGPMVRHYALLYAFHTLLNMFMGWSGYMKLQ